MKLPVSLLMLFLLFAQQSLAQRTVTGVVSDGENKEPLPGASVLLKGTRTATTTGADGKFSMNVDANAKTLLISFIGFTDQEVSITNESNLNIALQHKSNLEEVVV